MALSVNEILKSAKIAGMELSKVKTEAGGFYFLAEFRGEEKTIMVNKLSDLTRAQWVDELLYFAELVEENQANLVPIPTEEAPPVENGLEMDPAAGEAFETPLDAAPEQAQPTTGAVQEAEPALAAEEAPAAEEAAPVAQPEPAVRRTYNKVDASAIYFWAGPSVSTRREGSSARAYEDWMISNPGATTEEIKAAGHDLKHLRWDIRQGWIETR